MDGSHHSKNDDRRVLLCLRDWRKRGNADEVVVVMDKKKEELSEEWMGQEKVRGGSGGQEDQRTVVSAKEWNEKEHENVLPQQRLRPQEEGLGDQSMMKPAGNWRKEKEFVLQEPPSSPERRQKFDIYARGATNGQFSHTYGSIHHPEEDHHHPLSYPHPPALEKELEESSYHQMGERGM